MTVIRIEVVYAKPDRQLLLEVCIDSGTTVAEALEASAIYDRFPNDALEQKPVGIWGRLVERESIPADGDRIEIYRQLKRDPREARRERALKGS